MKRTKTITISLDPAVKATAELRVAELGQPYTFSSYVARLILEDSEKKLLVNGIPGKEAPAKHLVTAQDIQNCEDCGGVGCGWHREGCPKFMAFIKSSVYLTHE